MGEGREPVTSLRESRAIPELVLIRSFLKGRRDFRSVERRQLTGRVGVQRRLLATGRLSSYSQRL